MEPVTLAGAVASLGIPAAVAYFSAQGNRAASVYRRGLALAIIPTTATFIALYVLSFEVSQQQGVPQVILIMAWAFIFPSAIVQIRRGYWQGQGHWRKLDAERFGFAILRFVVVCALAYAGITYAPVFAIGSLIAFGVAALILWTSSKGAVSGRGRTTYRSVAKYSVGASIGTIAIVANNRLDQVLLPLVSSSQELGYYAIAVTVAEVPLIFGALAARNALHGAGQGKSLKDILTAISPFLIGAFVLSATLAGVSASFVPFFFGNDFAPSVLPVQILVIGTGLACVSMTLISIIAGRGWPAASSIVPLGGLIVTVVGFIYIGSAMTSTAAAIIALCSQGFSLVVAVFVMLFLRYRNRRQRSVGVNTKLLQGVTASGRRV